MSAVIIGDRERKLIKAYVSNTKVTSLKELKYLNDNPDIRVGDKHNIVIPIEYTVTYTEEEQPVGECRHISISSPNKNKVPNVHCVNMIMKEFGFKGVINSTYSIDPDSPIVHIYLEDCGDFQAVNVIEKKN